MVLKKHWPWLFLALLPLIPLWRAIFLGEAIGPFDQIRQMGPWHTPSAKTQAWDVLQADGVLQFYVWRDLVFDAWRSGVVPFWNPYELAGTPLLANSQSAALYPPHILLGVLHIPTALAIALLAWFHLFMAGLGVSKLTQRLGANEVGGVVAGASFSLSAFMLSWTALSSVITTVCWIPWLLYAIATILREGRGYAALVATTALMVLGGHLQFVAYGALAAIIFTVGLLIESKDRTLKPVLGIVLAGIAGVLIAAPQLLPVLKYSEFSHRRNTPTAEGYQAYLGGALKPFELANTGYALSLGDPREGVPTQDGLVYPAYWPAFAKPGGNFAESAVALGPLVLALLFLAPWRRRIPGLAAVAGLGILALLLALGTVFNAALFYGVPGWSSTGSPGRIVVLVVMAACVVGGVAISNLPKLPEKGLPRLLPLIVPLFATAAFLMVRGMAQVPEAVEGLRSLALQSALPGLMISVVVATAALALAYHLDRPLSKAAVLAAPIVIALTSGALTLTPSGKPLALQSEGQDAFIRRAFVNAGWELLVTPYLAVMPPNTASLSRWHDLAGYDSLLHRETKALLDGINEADSAPPANGNMMLVKPSFNPQKLAEAGVTEVWSSKPLPQMNQPEPGQEGIYKYKLAGPGRASVAEGQTKIVSESATHVALEVQGSGRLTLRDRNMPGWTAAIDGRPVPIGESAWLEIDVPEGSRTVRFTYQAPGFTTGLGLSIATLLVGTAALAFARRRRATT